MRFACALSRNGRDGDYDLRRAERCTPQRRRRRLAGEAQSQRRARDDAALARRRAGRARQRGCRSSRRSRIYRARQPSGASVIVAPGGGYGALASNHEGRQVANLLNAAGVTAFVLKYRLGPRYRHPIELGDAQRAIRLVRARAPEFGIAADRIGMHGLLGGRTPGGDRRDALRRGQGRTPPIPSIASAAGPTSSILGYPVISFDPAIAHSGSVRNLLGENPDPKLIEDLSNDLQVTPQTPPTFLFHTNADTGVVAENSVRFYLALRRAKVPAEMHIFENGPHGVGLALGDPALSAWPDAADELAAGTRAHEVGLTASRGVADLVRPLLRRLIRRG